MATPTVKTTGTTTCERKGFFGEKCNRRHGHTARHTWDTNDYRRKKRETLSKAEVKTTSSHKSKKKAEKPSVVEPAGSSTATETSEIIDVMISFDTTGSMYSCLEQVRSNVASLVSDLFKDIPDLRIGIIAHGDYCDAPGGTRGHHGRSDSYVTKMLDLSRDEKKICNFVKTVGRTGGGDSAECYELVLHEARTGASWEKGRHKVLVMIGDDEPHPVSYWGNTKKIDWRLEAKALGADGVAVYTVQCLRFVHGIRARVDEFWRETASITGGHHLELDHFENIRDLIKAVCYKQQSVEALETFVRAVEHSGRMSGGMARVYSTLLGYEISADGAEADGAKHIDPSRFIVFKVTDDVDIRSFVESKRKKFRTGCGFYQFTKSVKVQDHKEVILLEEATGDMFGGAEARRILGLPSYGTVEVNPKSCAALQDGRYTAFVQSTSNNRKLIKGTKFLYENEHWDR